MRISQLPTLAICLSIGGLAAWAALGSMHDVAVAAPLDSVTSSECQNLPVPTPSASASASASATGSPTATATPADLCLSVQATQDSFQAGQNATWTVDVWAPNGPAYGVTVTLSGTLADQTPTFANQCPGGNGNDNCTVGSVGPTSESMQVQIPIPAGTASGTSVTLTAAADAVPSLTTEPTAATTVTTTVAPAASSSPTTSASATPSPSKGSTATSAATPKPGTTPGATAGTTLTPGIGTISNYTGSVTPATGVSAVTDPGSITSLLPAITPGAGATAPAGGFDTSPAADDPANAGATSDRATDASSVLVVPVATAEKIGGVILLLLAGLIVRLRMRPKKKVVPAVASGGASGGAPTGSAPAATASPPSGDAPSGGAPSEARNEEAQAAASAATSRTS